MPTLDQAARQLGISEKTLRKWMKRLGIERTRHPQDWRYWLITDEQIEQIRQERALMPGYPPVILSSNSLAFRRSSPRLPDVPIATDSSSPLAPMPRPRSTRTRAQFDGSLPDGLVRIMEVAEAHSVSRYLSAFYRWQREGKLDCDPVDASGEHGGRFAVKYALTRKGLAQFYQLASRKDGFKRCDLCPHAEEEQPQERAPGSGGE